MEAERGEQERLKREGLTEENDKRESEHDVGSLQLNT